MRTVSKPHISHTPKLSDGLAWLAALVLVIAGGCRSDELPSDDGADTESLRVEFTIFADGPDRSTRAPAEPDDDSFMAGEMYENFIDIDAQDFRFYFFDDSKKYKGSLSVEKVRLVGGYFGNARYKVTGKVSPELKNTKVKIMALANWQGKYPEDKDFIGSYENGIDNDIDFVARYHSFTYNANEHLPSASNRIPMYGIVERELNFDEAGNSLLESDIEIHMLRAWVKIEIIGSSEGEELDSAEVVYYNTAGYSAPYQVYSETDYLDPEQPEYTKSPHIPTGAKIETESTVTLVRSGERRFIGYVPEFVNKNVDRPALIRLRFKEAPDVAESLYFCNYQDGKPVMEEKFDLLRNNWYVYSVKKNRNLTVELVPYTAIELEPEFGHKPEEGTN